LLSKYIDYLGGFPVIIKEVGSTRGLGTIKIESWQNLISTADFLIESQCKFIIRQFINSDFGARIVVLGNRIISSSKFYFHTDDFRNAVFLSQTRFEDFSMSDEAISTCIQAVQCLNYELGGVDLLFDSKGNMYILEVNHPIGIASFGINALPIVTQMVQHLCKKSINKYAGKCSNSH